MSTEGLTWLAELPAHPLSASDALFLRESGAPVTYIAATGNRSGEILVDEAGGGKTFVVARKDLSIRQGQKRAVAAPAPMPVRVAAQAAIPARAAAAPAPAAAAARSPAAVPAAVATPAARPIQHRPVPAVSAPSRTSPQPLPGNLSASDAQRVAAITAARDLSLAIVKLQAEAAAAGRPLTVAAALHILKTRGQVPPAPGSR